MDELKNIWVVGAEYYKGYEIKLTFNDGLSGIVDLKDEFDQPVFQPLKDLNYFKNFKLNSWTIAWENGADFAPEFLYGRVRSSVLMK